MLRALIISRQGNLHLGLEIRVGNEIMLFLNKNISGVGIQLRQFFRLCAK